MKVLGRCLQTLAWTPAHMKGLADLPSATHAIGATVLSTAAERIDKRMLSAIARKALMMQEKSRFGVPYRAHTHSMATAATTHETPASPLHTPLRKGMTRQAAWLEGDSKEVTGFEGLQKVVTRGVSTVV